MSTFQLTLIGIFIFALVIGVLVFAGILPGYRAPQGGTGGTVVLWGTIPQDDFDKAFEDFKNSHREEFTLVYRAKNPRTFESELVDTLAAGGGPDLVLLPHTSLYKQLNKIQLIPYASFTDRAFRDSFIKEGELYLFPDGIAALPVLVDPMVMYFNTDLLTNARLTKPPKTWNDLQQVLRSLTVADTQGNITQSAIALGLFNNITHAKDILSLLFLQAGNPIITNTNGFKVVLSNTLGNAQAPAGEAVKFFNSFADSSSPLYSWNSALPEARDFFARGNLVMYLGFASELNRIRQQNPQLNIDLAVVPQPTGRSNMTIGRLYGLSVLKNSRNMATALSVAGLLSSAEGAKTLSHAAGLPAARPDLLGVVPEDSIQTVINQAAILARGWFDPDPVASQKIFQTMIDSIQVRGAKLDGAIEQANDELRLLIK